jgi:outer membrane receptor protein involved in Fe transport
MVPYTDYFRKTLAFSGTSNPVDKLTFSASGSYILANSNNQPGYGYTANNVMQQFTWTGRQVDYDLLRQKQRNADGSIFNWNHNYHNNPFMTLKENLNAMDRNRFMGNAMIKYQFTPWLSAFVRTGGDIYSNSASERKFVGDMDFRTGNYYEDVRLFREFNTDFLVSLNKSLSDWSFTLNIGGNRMDRRYQRNTGEAPELAIPGVYNLGNSLTTPVVTNYLATKRINSVYGFGQIGFRNAIFLDYSLRNDWSSTLPEDNNSYLYPGFSLSAVVTDLLNMKSDVLSFAKVRASWAQVGGDTDPYQLLPTVAFGDSWNAGTRLPNLFVPNELPNAELKPQTNESIELGVDLRFFVDRIRLDVTYYNQKSIDQIVSIPISGASGYLTKTINAGRIDNKGLELQLGLTPVKFGDFKWDINLNWSKNTNEVVELYPGIEQFVLGSYWSMQLLAIPKQAYGVLYGYDFERDPDGNIIFYDGLPSQDPNLKVLGNVTPDWLAGISNEFTWKNLTAGVLIDMRHGGDLYSMTTTWGRYAGALEETLIGREGGIVGKGVMPDGNGGYVPNTVVADAEKFNKESYHNNLQWSSVFDASFVKLREVKIGYTFNVKKLPIREFNVSAVGRNLAILSTNVPHVDPETAFSNGNVQGFEFGQLPSARSLGFSVGVKF